MARCDEKRKGGKNVIVVSQKERMNPSINNTSKGQTTSINPLTQRRKKTDKPVSHERLKARTNLRAVLLTLLCSVPGVGLCDCWLPVPGNAWSPSSVRGETRPSLGGGTPLSVGDGLPPSVRGWLSSSSGAP
jgi:hypothetical protein